VPDGLFITIDNTALFAALDAIPEAIAGGLKDEARVTAEHIQTEQRARIKRRTGQTAEAITVEETRRGDGYVVSVASARNKVAFLLQWGTRFMRGDDFFFAAARIEEAAHDRRSRQAIQDAIDASGLGESSGGG
jgi:hypothetical protein